mmetsp:Transcript_49134/g.158116  ORF Transcript_49134/g.158116 Transcript_49134/m.158116 type:complete len:202 (-) Transcript_49134:132-737(-)
MSVEVSRTDVNAVCGRASLLERVAAAATAHICGGLECRRAAQYIAGKHLPQLSLGHLSTASLPLSSISPASWARLPQLPQHAQRATKGARAARGVGARRRWLQLQPLLRNVEGRPHRHAGGEHERAGEHDPRVALPGGAVGGLARGDLLGGLVVGEGGRAERRRPHQPRRQPSPQRERSLVARELQHRRRHGQPLQLEVVL